MKKSDKSNFFDSIHEVDIDSVNPSPINEKVYKPILESDPKIRELSKSIRENGLLEPITLTLDNFIISGHRRYTASKMAHLDTVRAKYHPVKSDDPDLIKLLTEFNNQRIKSVDEVLRERVIKMTKEEAYQRLIDYRKEKSKIDLTTIDFGKENKRKKISSNSMGFLEAVITVLYSLKNYWPVSDRTVHYQLLNLVFLTHLKKAKSFYVNDEKSYKKLTDLLTRARIEGKIPFHAIKDDTRPSGGGGGFASVDRYIETEINSLFNYYSRNYSQSQPNHIEIWGEKMTIETIVRRTTYKYKLGYTLMRGFSSLSPRYDLYKRFKESGKEKLVLLFLTDFDTEGEEIPRAFARSMTYDFGIPKEKIVPIKVALNHEQVKEFNLPAKLKAKEKSVNYKKFSSKYGDDVFELESLKPEKLESLLDEAIRSVLDIDLFNQEVEKEKEESLILFQKREELLSLL